MIRSFTTVEQSKKLVEAGVDPRTADMYYDKYGKLGMPISGRIRYKGFFETYPECKPCWSMARLMALLPDEIVLDKDKRTRRTFVFSIEKFEPWQYSVAYYRHNAQDEIETIWDEIKLDSPLDLLVDCLIWVMTNGYEDKETQREIAEKE